MASLPGSTRANTRRRRTSAVDEITPLLVASEEGPTTQANEEVFDEHPELQPKSTNDREGDDEEDIPLPMGQIFVLCYARMIEPIVFFCIFPFVNQMIFDTGAVREEDVGFWSGLIESLFSLTQMSLMLPWSKLSDRVGRKPTLVCSMVGMSLMSSLFGFSQSVWQMILFRCLAGLFSGTIVTVRTMITENSTAKTQARAFSYFAFAGNLGIFLGPLIGGGLSNPADQFPNVFGGPFFQKFPYALPTIVTGVFALSATLTALVFLKETNPRDETKPISEEDGTQPLINGRASPAEPNGVAAVLPDPDTLTTLRLIRYPGVPPVLAVYGLVMLLALAYTAVSPVFWFTAVHLGGFGFSPPLISALLALAGVSQALWILVVFPPLNGRLGTVGALKLVGGLGPLAYVLYAGASVLRRLGFEWGFWVTAIAVVVFGSGFSMAFTGVQLALNSISPSPRTLSTLNALALMMVAGIRAFAPALFASIFAFGVRNQILWGYFVWVFLVVLAVGLRFLMEYLPPEADGYREPKQRRARDENGSAEGS